MRALGRFAANAALALAGTLVVADDARAEPPDEGAAVAPPPKRHALEASLFLGGTYALDEVAYPTTATSNQRIGMGGALSVAYRGPYFLYPFMEVGHYRLSHATGPGLVDDQGTTVLVSSEISEWSFFGGPAVDLWRLRLRAGFGLEALQRTGFANGATSTVGSSRLSSILGIGVRLIDRDGFALLAEGRYVSSPNVASSFVAWGLTLKSDFLRW